MVLLALKTTKATFAVELPLRHYWKVIVYLKMRKSNKVVPRCHIEYHSWSLQGDIIMSEYSSVEVPNYTTSIDPRMHQGIKLNYDHTS
jgi:hypothetical protein